MREVAIVSPVRTAVGSFGGGLRGVQAAELGSTVIKEALDRSGLDPAKVDDVILGHGYPNGENPVTTVNIGHGLPRALVANGVSVASVADIDAYGLLTAVEEAQRRQRMLDHFAKMYAPATGRGAVVDYVAQTGMDALNGADLIKLAPKKYESQVEYASTQVAKNLRDVAQVHLADEVKQVSQERKKADQRLRRLAQVYVDGHLTEEEYRRQKKQQEEKLRSLSESSWSTCRAFGRRPITVNDGVYC